MTSQLPQRRVRQRSWRPLRWLRAGFDIDGDPLPDGVIARLGTKRFRPSHVPIALSFLPDGKSFALTTDDGWQQHWDAVSGRLLRQRRLSEHPISAAAIAADRPLVAAQGSYLVVPDKWCLVVSWRFFGCELVRMIAKGVVGG